MKKYIEKNELAALFFLHYFKYTRFAFKKNKNEEDKASIHAHRELMRILGRWYSKEERVIGKDVIDSILSNLASSPASNYAGIVTEVLKESIRFIYDNVLSDEKEHRLLERYV